MLLMNGTPDRCGRLLAGTAGNPQREAGFPVGVCERCGSKYLVGAAPDVKHNYAFPRRPAPPPEGASK